MATTKKQKRKKTRRAHGPTCEIAIRERLHALDDAAKSSVHAIAAHSNVHDAVQTVMTALFLSAADIIWHATDASEEAFVEVARSAFQQTAEAHARCDRGQPIPPDGAREDLH